MGKIASATTVYASAYLTEKGRQYLFNQNNIRFDSNGNDLFQIQTFTLSDADTNYNTPVQLPSGGVPNVTGNLKATADIQQTILSYFTVDAMAFVNPVYTTSIQNGTSTVQTTELALDLGSSSDFPVSSATDTPPTNPTVPVNTSSTNSL